MAMNRIKVILAEKQLTSKWLAKELGEGSRTLSPVGIQTRYSPHWRILSKSTKTRYREAYSYCTNQGEN